MPMRDDLLAPIAGDNPAGADLRYDPVYDQIKEARREELDVPQGDWQHARKTADYPLVIKLAGEVLAKRSKDLQLAAWLTEALLHREGFGGLQAGLSLVRGLIEQFWEQLYPELEDGDAELRAAPLEWIGSRLDAVVKSVPLNRSGHGFFQYTESRLIGYEEDASDDPAKQEARQQAVEDGKPTAEEFDKGFDATPKAWYKQLAADLRGAMEALQTLDDVCAARFGNDAPGYGGLRDALGEVDHAVAVLLAKKLELDPDPPEPEPAPDAMAADVLDGAVGGEGGAAGASGTLAAEPTSAADAGARVIGAARFLRHADATNPVPYLMLRALRWGELRARGSTPDPRMLEAPAGTSRVQLRRLMLDGNWAQLLEAAEAVMATPAGRGWLDLQRYVVSACEELGDEYGRVASAVRAELRNLLAEVPELPGMSLMDDMPAANQETRDWVQAVVSSSDGDPASVEAGAGEPIAAPVRANGRGDRSLDRAMAEVRSGHPERAIEILMRELDREKSRRGRFLRQSQLARIMVDAGLESVATPILEEMVSVIETHRLEEWEPGELVAEPLMLLYKCIEKAEGDESTMRELYLRICRLDPVRAIGVTTR
jgi:type VI secretion system protein ImpA